MVCNIHLKTYMSGSGSSVYSFIPRLIFFFCVWGEPGCKVENATVTMYVHIYWSQILGKQEATCNIPEMVTLTNYGEGNLANQNRPDMASNVYLMEPFRLHHMIQTCWVKGEEVKSQLVSLPRDEGKVGSCWKPNSGQCLEVPVFWSLSYGHQPTTSPRVSYRVFGEM